MSYLVLARKWRPQRFDELVGQPHVARTLLNGLRQKRLAHAYIFSGPRGVGKTTAARLLARAVNCLDPRDGEPCAECAPCKSIGAGSFIDVVEIDAASNNGVNDVRNLRDSIRYAPIEGRAKIYIIDEVHMLSVQAFNALLKTLEEPPSHAYFCLATTEVQKIPPTIVSRCQRFDFRRVPLVEIKAHLVKICQAEHVNFEVEALDLIARRADGSVRDSLSILDQVLAYTGGTVKRGETLEIVGEVRNDLYHRALGLALGLDSTAALELDRELAQIGADALDFITGLEGYIVKGLEVKGMGAQQADVPAESRPELEAVSAQFSEADLVRLLQLCITAENDVRRNFNPRLRLQLLLLRFAQFEQSLVLGELLDQLQSGAPKGGNPSTAARKPAPPSPVKRPEQDEKPAPPSPPEAQTALVRPDNPLKAAQEAWNGICDQVAEEHNSRGRMVKFSAFPVEYHAGRLKIHCTSDHMLSIAKSCQNALLQAITAVIGEVRIELVVGPLPEGSSAPERMDDDPAVQLLKDRLDAEPLN